MIEAPFKISEAKKKTGVYCCAYGCKNAPVKKKRNLCHKHYARITRVMDPIASRYNQFKCNATRRKKEFNITIKQFRTFCNETGYIITAGKRGMNATIDRIDNSKGYSIDNIQLLTNRQNASKGDRACPF